jgi:hypothetical protein
MSQQVTYKCYDLKSSRNDDSTPYEPLIYTSLTSFQNEIKNLKDDDELNAWWQEKHKDLVIEFTFGQEFVLYDTAKNPYCLPIECYPIFNWIEDRDTDILDEVWIKQSPLFRFTFINKTTGEDDRNKPKKRLVFKSSLSTESKPLISSSCINHTDEPYEAIIHTQLYIKPWIEAIEKMETPGKIHMWWQDKLKTINLWRIMYGQIIMNEQQPTLEENEKCSYRLPSLWEPIFNWTNSSNINTIWQREAPLLRIKYTAEDDEINSQTSEISQQNIPKKQPNKNLTSQETTNENGERVLQKVSMKNINDYLDELLKEDEKLVLSSSLDILATYLKFQKTLYTEAKVYCEQQLNYLMLPAIMISAFCTVLSQAIQYQQSGAIIISVLTACNSFILSLISYLKLDAKAEAHKSSAYQYEKLQALAEFNSGKVMYFNIDEKLIKDHTIIDISSNQIQPHVKTMKEVVYELVDSIEQKINEIKEMNKFILPEAVRGRFMFIYNRNIFSAIKKVRQHEYKLRTHFLMSVNQIVDAKMTFTSEELMRDLRKNRDRILNEILSIKDEFDNECKGIEKQIEDDMLRRNKSWCNCFRWLKT